MTAVVYASLALVWKTVNLPACKLLYAICTCTLLLGGPAFVFAVGV